LKAAISTFNHQFGVEGYGDVPDPAPKAEAKVAAPKTEAKAEAPKADAKAKVAPKKPKAKA